MKKRMKKHVEKHISKSAEKDMPALEELERIHESDRTKKQTRWLEKRRLEKMTWKGKLDYILTYHRAAVAVLVLLLLLPFGLRQWVEYQKQNIILSVAVVNSAEVDSAKLEEGIKSLAGSGSKYDVVTVYTDIYTDEEGIFDYNSMMFVNVHVAAAEIDLMVMDQESYEFCRDREFLMDTKRLLGAVFCEEHSDKVKRDCILVESSSLSDLMTLGYDTAYIGVMENAQNAETAAGWIRYLLGQ